MTVFDWRVDASTISTVGQIDPLLVILDATINGHIMRCNITLMPHHYKYRDCERYEYELTQLMSVIAGNQTFTLYQTECISLYVCCYVCLSVTVLLSLVKPKTSNNLE